MTRTHKLLFLLVTPATWSVLFLGVRFCGLTVEKLRPWGNFFAVACLAAWAVLVALDSPYAELAMGLLLSLLVAVHWIGWFERRARLRSGSQPT